MKVRIDKDYCSDPVWVMEDGESFYANGYLPDFKDILSEELLKDLENYSELWESYFWELFKTSTLTEAEETGIETFDLLAKVLAFRCKLEAPHIQWAYWNPKTKQVMEI